MIIGTNEYGTPIGQFTCKFCGDDFSVCPAPDDLARREKWWADWDRDGCLGPHCPSYDPNRDAEVLFMTDAEVDQLPIVGMDMLRARKTGGVQGTHE